MYLSNILAITIMYMLKYCIKYLLHRKTDDVYQHTGPNLDFVLPKC